MNNIIELLQRQQLIFNASTQRQTQNVTETGYGELDHALNGGLTQIGVIELLSQTAIGELRLLMPSLYSDSTRLLVLVSPPAHVNAQMFSAQGIKLKNILVIQPDNFKDSLWAVEQCLSSGSCHSVLFWPENELAIHQIKRFQLACEKGQCRHILFRAERLERISLPLELSLSLYAQSSGLLAKVNKRKCGWPSKAFNIDMSSRWPELIQPSRPKNILTFPAATSA
ncbi:translesion DNA synthesis-associated protein ImuA [Catenovulum adriaticum]|uniref:Translesion DNA synthesis-associated protein ImuA n=1 Tax=Catenovulum adriaticum TaxID=2984846 RepID=A0ABY7AKS9_9ALTE|nr:translesion DNA synthesis-associated protein ImuA [Catenovulum sp. TS8]WAJ69887.1 translesion DNA synthesis-associated protein ImuA [Catenovulum sp. TS8]